MSVETLLGVRHATIQLERQLERVSRAAHLPGMSTHQPSQHPRGGDGQFTTKARAGPAVTVAPEAPAVVLGAETFEDDEFGGTWDSPGKGNASFDTAVRALLGVTDQRRKVTSSMRGGDCGSTYTPGAGQRVLRGAERRLPRPV